MGERHYHRCRDALAADVADAEMQLLVADEKVVEVAAHFLGRLQYAVDVDVLALGVGRVGLWQHFHLDILGDTQLVVDTLLLHVGQLQAPVVSGKAVHDPY